MLNIRNENWERFLIILWCYTNAFKRQPSKMVKHTRTIRPTIRGLLPTNCFSVFGHLVGLALKGLSYMGDNDCVETFTQGCQKWKRDVHFLVHRFRNDMQYLLTDHSHNYCYLTPQRYIIIQIRFWSKIKHALQNPWY